MKSNSPTDLLHLNPNNATSQEIRQEVVKLWKKDPIEAAMAHYSDVIVHVQRVIWPKRCSLVFFLWVSQIVFFGFHKKQIKTEKNLKKKNKKQKKTKKTKNCDLF